MSDAGDDDLVDDFLAAAGIGGSPLHDGSQPPSPTPSKPTPKKRKNPAKASTSKTKRRKPSSDSGSADGEISDSELDDLAITPPPRNSRRATRKDESPEEEDSFENPYPLENKYKNEEDRERLLNMSELERERVLFERAEELKRIKERQDLAALVRAQAKDQPRRSGREGQLRSEKAGKRDDLSELKKRREEKSNASKVKTPTKLKFVVDKEGEEYSEDSGEVSDREAKKTDESGVRITFSNVGPITLTRNFFSKYFYYPHFESAITGCYTRVRVSEKDNDYRFARIEGLAMVPKYTVEDIPVDRGLELSQGTNKKVINMDFASNSPVTEDEFKRYVRMVTEAKGILASRRHLDKKVKEIQDLQAYKLADADITAMIEKKRSLSRIPRNVVHEKARLKQLHLAALSSGNESEAERIQEQLGQLEELAQGSRDKSISRENEMFLKVNERNRKMNMLEMREAERRGAEERKRNALSTDASVMDPFSRRKTIPKTFYENLVSSRGGSPTSSGVTTPNLGPTSTAIPDKMEKLNLDAPATQKGVDTKPLKMEDVIAQADFGIDIEI